MHPVWLILNYLFFKFSNLVFFFAKENDTKARFNRVDNASIYVENGSYLKNLSSFDFIINESLKSGNYICIDSFYRNKTSSRETIKSNIYTKVL